MTNICRFTEGDLHLKPNSRYYSIKKALHEVNAKLEVEKNFAIKTLLTEIEINSIKKNLSIDREITFGDV